MSFGRRELTAVGQLSAAVVELALAADVEDGLLFVLHASAVANGCLSQLQ